MISKCFYTSFTQLVSSVFMYCSSRTAMAYSRSSSFSSCLICLYSSPRRDCTAIPLARAILSIILQWWANSLSFSFWGLTIFSLSVSSAYSLRRVSFCTRAYLKLANSSSWGCLYSRMLRCMKRVVTGSLAIDSVSLTISRLYGILGKGEGCNWGGLAGVNLRSCFINLWLTASSF